MLDKQNRFLYFDKFNLLNKAEYRIYHQLQQAAPRYLIFTQVSITQLFHIPPKHAFHLLNQVGRKSVDFVLCRPDTSIVMAVELNGPYYDSPEQIDCDSVKRLFLQQVGIPLLVLYTDVDLHIQQLRAAIAPLVVMRIQYETAKRLRMQKAMITT